MLRTGTGPRRGTGATIEGVPIEDHAAIGDGRTVALIDRDGTVDWLPLPALTSAPVFAAVLDDPDGGRIELAPTGEYRAERRYLPGTNVLETTFTTTKGSVRVTDALVTGVAGRLPWAELARSVEGVSGSVTMLWRVTPGTLLGGRSPWIDANGSGAVIRVGDLSIGVVTERMGTATTEPDAAHPSVGGRFRSSEGSRHVLVVAATENEPLHLPDPGNVQRGVTRTIDSWERWSQEFSYDGPWREAVQRSALALKLLIYSPTGAIAAAATTSLPENPAGGKNWDYRYAWVRDLAYTTSALIQFGLREETHAALSWLLRTIKRNGPELHVFYTLHGDPPDEVRESQAPGWRGIGPVVTGNPAGDQLQLGAYGDLLGIVRSYVHAGNLLDVETGRYLADVADRVCDNWRLPDSGMWELPDPEHHTSSKMACWQALDAAVQLAEAGHIVDRRDRWEAERERIRAWIHENCWSDDLGAWTMTAGGERLDTSVLLHAPSGFDRGDRMSSTIDALCAELANGHRVHRYSGMRAEEHPFVACGFWVAAALACVGRQDEAVAQMDAAVADANDVGLLAEMVAIDGAFWGNFPQGLSHLALIDAAVVIREMSR